MNPQLALDVDIEPQRLAELPLVTVDSDGVVTAHALWGEALEGVLDAQAERAGLTALANSYRSAGDLDAAVGLFAEAEAWDDMLAAMLEACSLASGAGVRPGVAGDWLELVPEEHEDAPEVQLAMGLMTRDRDPGSAEAREFFWAAAHGFRERDAKRDEVAALTQLGYLYRIAAEVDDRMRVQQRLDELAAAGSIEAELFLAIDRAAFEQVTIGDHETALAAAQSVDPDLLPDEWRVARDWVIVAALSQLGRPAEAVEVARQTPSGRAAMLPGSRVAWAVAAWFSGGAGKIVQGDIPGDISGAIPPATATSRASSWHSPQRQPGVAQKQRRG